MDLLNIWGYPSLKGKIDKIILNPGNIILNRDEERTFSAIGVREDFECDFIYVQ